MAHALEYNEGRPDAAGADIVRCIWSLRGKANDANDADGAVADPIVSDGCVEIVFNLADPFEHVSSENGSVSRQPLTIVVGPTALPAVVRPTGVIDIVGVRLQPWAGAAVLGLSMRELRDQFTPLADMSHPSLLELSDRLHGLRSDGERFRLASRLFTHHASAARRGDPTARIAVEQLPAAGSGYDAPTVRALAGRLGRTVRTIQRVFAEDVGLAPKTMQRIARIQRALALARAAKPLRWSTIAVEAGYHDQPHFVRDFRELVGCTPSAFRREEVSLTTSFLSGD